MKPALKVPARLLLVALAGLLAGGLTGCSRAKQADDRCDEVAEYQASQSVAGVTTPEGLLPAAKPSGYTVPPAANQTQTQVPGAACLARPPDYFRRDVPAAPAGTPPPPGK